MDGKRMKEIIGAFFTNNGSEICKEIPELTDCKELKKTIRRSNKQKRRLYSL